MTFRLCLTCILCTFGIGLSAQHSRATFVYEKSDGKGKSASFQFYDKDGKQVFDVKSSSGFKEAANDPYHQGEKDRGPLPFGTWFICGIKKKAEIELRLCPGNDVVSKNRDGILIHGRGKHKTADESSTGCIILEKKYREILMRAFEEEKEQIPIKVIPVSSGDTG